jgi:hypothetical protein
MAVFPPNSPGQPADCVPSSSPKFDLVMPASRTIIPQKLLFAYNANEQEMGPFQPK